MSRVGIEKISEYSGATELQQDQAVSLEEAELQLQRAGAAIQPYGDFDRVPGPLLWAFKEAADQRDLAAAREEVEDAA